MPIATTRPALLLLLTVVAGAVTIPADATARDAPWPGQTLNGRDCSEFAYTHAYGPYNYNNPRHRSEKLPIVEKAHFTNDVRTLKRGANSSSPLGDLEYTLGAFPNHPQALYSMIRYATEHAYRRESQRAWKTTSRLGRARPPAECYLQRATRFAPDDHRVRILYGLFLHRNGENERALETYQSAVKLQPSSAEAHYNMGLLLYDMGRYRSSKKHAQTAYELDYPLKGLRKKLAAKGHEIAE